MRQETDAKRDGSINSFHQWLQKGGLQQVTQGPGIESRSPTGGE